MTLDKSIALLETKLTELKTLPYKDVTEWIDSIELALSILRHNKEYERDLDDMYEEYLRKGAA